HRHRTPSCARWPSSCATRTVRGAVTTSAMTTCSSTRPAFPTFSPPMVSTRPSVTPSVASHFPWGSEPSSGIDARAESLCKLSWDDERGEATTTWDDYVLPVGVAKFQRRERTCGELGVELGDRFAVAVTRQAEREVVDCRVVPDDQHRVDVVAHCMQAGHEI